MIDHWILDYLNIRNIFLKDVSFQVPKIKLRFTIKPFTFKN
jgi:preprotein translocase subunit SecB